MTRYVLAILMLYPSLGWAGGEGIIRWCPPPKCIRLVGDSGITCRDCPIAPEQCSPCVNGCTDNVCNDDSRIDDDGLPWMAIDAMEDGYTCWATSAGGYCDIGYAWSCDREWCSDTDDVFWRPTVAP